MNRRALGIGGLVALLVIVLWYMLLWSPANGDVQEANDRQEVAEQQATQLRAELQRLRAARDNEITQRGKLDKLRFGIPKEPDLAQFILDTNEAAVAAGIDFISVSPTPPAAASPPPAAAATATTTTTVAGAAAPGAATTATPPAEIRISLQIQGGYFQAIDFLNRLDLMERIVVTDNLTVTADAGGRLSVTIAARMFTEALPAGFGGVAATTTTTTVPGPTTTTVAGATTTTAPGATTTTTAGARP